jgi:uncharacterized protein (TIGR00251 family)
VSGSVRNAGQGAARRFEVRVQPRASKNEIAGIREGVLRIRLQAPPVEGAANEALVRFLANELGISTRQVRIISGLGSRNKVVEVDIVASPALDRLLSST